MKKALFSHTIVFSILMFLPSIFPIESNAQQIWENDLLLKAHHHSITSQAIAVDLNGNPHVVTNSDYLHYSWYDGNNWLTETIDPHLQLLSAASIGVNTGETVDLLFYSDHDIFHAKKNGSTWDFHQLDRTNRLNPCTIRYDSSGRMHTAWINYSNKLTHAIFDKGNWSFYTVANGVYAFPGWGFDLDSNGEPHFLVQDDYKLEYIHYHDNRWHRETAQNLTVDTRIFGFALDNANQPHALFRKGGVLYLYKNGDQWITHLLDEEAIADMSLIRDPYDTMHVFLVAQNRLTHLFLVNSQWEREEMDIGNDYSGEVSAAYDWRGQFSILAKNKTLSRLNCFTGSSYHWMEHGITEYGDFGNCNIVVDQKKEVHLLFTNNSNNQLVYAHGVDEQFQFELLENLMGDESGQCAIGIDGSGFIHITYYHAKNRTLYHAVKTEEGWQKEIISEDVTIRDSQMVITSGGAVIILVATNYHLLLYRNYGESWEQDVLDTGSIRAVSLCLDAVGSPCCAYFKYNYEKSCTLFYQQIVNEEWVKETVSGTKGTGLERLQLKVTREGISVICFERVTWDSHAGEGRYGTARYRDDRGWHLSKISSYMIGTKFALNLDHQGDLIIASNSILFFWTDSKESIQSQFAPSNSVLDVESLTVDGGGRPHLLHKIGSDLYYTHQKLPATGVRLEMSSDLFSKYSNIFLIAYLRSDNSALHQAPMCILLEYQQNYWFWPDWTEQFNVESVDVNEKGSVLLPIPWFSLRDSLVQPLNGLTFWGALLNDDLIEIHGGVDGIGKWEFSIQ